MRPNPVSLCTHRTHPPRLPRPRRGLDYVVAGASRRGMRVILTLGNFWNAYKGPEAWLAWAAAASPNGTQGWSGDVLDFYRCLRARRPRRGMWFAKPMSGVRRRTAEPRPWRAAGDDA